MRQTLSHSLHEVAIILGTELTEAHLLSTFDLFLKDLDQVGGDAHVEHEACGLNASIICTKQVKAGVVRHLGKFLAVLSPGVREAYINIVEDIQSESVNWRFRKLIAKYERCFLGNDATNLLACC